MEKLVKNDNFMLIRGWMINELNLSGNNLNVYAIIYGFTQDGNHWFNGSREYLAAWCNCTVRGVQKNLNYLLDHNLIIKKPTSGFNQTCEYQCNMDFVPEN